LQTSVVSLRRGARLWPPRQALQIDLVSAVHIGDSDYYSTLQEKLTGYDRVLFELVADTTPAPGQGSGRWRAPPKGTPRPQRKGPLALVSALQRWVANTLALSFQLSELDISGDTFYHADMTLAGFSASQRARGESVFTLLAAAGRVALRGVLQPAADGASGWRRLTAGGRSLLGLLPLPLLAQLLAHTALSAADERPLARSLAAHAFLSGDAAAGLKLLLARQLAEASALAEGLAGSVILGERNAACVAAAEAAEEAGMRRVAVLYGAAHMPDLEARLGAALGVTRAGPPAWVRAWTVPLPALPQEQARPRARYPAITGPQTAALLALSTVLATDLYLWELLLRWASTLELFQR